MSREGIDRKVLEEAEDEMDAAAKRLAQYPEIVRQRNEAESQRDNLKAALVELVEAGAELSHDAPRPYEFLANTPSYLAALKEFDAVWSRARQLVEGEG